MKLQSSRDKWLWPKHGVAELNGTCQGHKYMQNVVFVGFFTCLEYMEN